ncbi:MAG: phage tail protein [Acetobacteraceae bacterium]
MSGSVGSSLSAPGSINDARTAAHLAIGQRLGKIDLTPLLIYTLANPAAGVLPLLQWQFDLSSPLWALLGSQESQVALVKQAIPLHRYQGTEYAITTIMAALGFSGVTILEGQSSWGGVSWPGNEGWAVFRVVTPATAPVAVMTQETAIAAINFFKPARCWLDSLMFTAPPQSETIPVSDYYGVPGQEPPIQISDSFSVPLQGIADSFAQSTFFNGVYYAAGGILATGTAAAIVDDGITIGGTPVT